MYRVLSEWDLGFENEIFATEEIAWREARKSWEQMDRDDDDTFEDYVDEGFFAVEKVKVVTE